MRLRVIIIRHGLPAAKILWTVASSHGPNQSAIPSSTVASTRVPNVAYGNEGCTIAQLLEDVNEVVPLETAIANGIGALGENDDFGGQWGLEDYVVEVDGFECLHFMHVDGLLRDGDEVVIRSLGIGDLRARRLSGRIQVSTDGRRLIDGVPFGRHFLQRSFSSRPPIRIPPRKRRRTMTSSGWTGNLQGEDIDNNDITPSIAAPYDNRLSLYDEASILPSEQGTVIRHPLNLFDDVDDSESDMDYSEGAEEDLAEELDQLREDAEDDVSIENITVRGSAGRKSRMAHRGHDPIPSSSPARPSIISTPRTTIGRGTEIEATPKSSKSVRFEADKSVLLRKSPGRQDESESDEESMSDSNSTVSDDSDDDSSESSDDEDFVSLESEAESEAQSESESESDSDSDSDLSSTSEEEESDSELESEVDKVRNPKHIDVFTPPGHGSTKTRNSNRRKKLRIRLQKLKELGELPPEANFDDLKKWELKNGKRPLTEVMDIEDLLDSRAKEQSEIEIKRQQLLRDLASGGIDVDGCSEKENIPPRYTNGKQDEEEKSPAVSKASAEEAQAATKVVDESEKASPSGIKRRKLDLSSTKRLLFGSLGVRTPKSKKDEEALRLKLAGSRDKYLPKTTETVPAQKEVEDELMDENWESKIILSATECVYDDIKLTAPAFPFQQRWDADAGYEIRQRRNNGKNNKKRKQRDWQDDVDTSWNDDIGENADEGVTLNYDDEPLATQNDYYQGSVNGDGTEDLPTLPSDPNSLPSLTESEATTGAIIAFKQLDMSKATNWQPQVSEYKVAKVDEVLESGSLNLVLAKRDREIRQAAVMDEDGVRQYYGFEMPEDDEDEDEGVEDDGFRTLSFTDLLEPKLLRSASRPEKQDGELENGNHDEASLELGSPLPVPVPTGGSSSASAENSVEADDNHLPPPPPVATAAVAVSSQTRRDITHMIHDAGFRSAIDSDLGLSMSIMENVAPRDSGNGAESEAESSSLESSSSSSSPSSSPSSNHEISSSPPEAMLEEQLQHDHFDSDAADKRDGDAGSIMETAWDSDDPGLPIGIDDGFEFDMDGRDDDVDNAGSEKDGNDPDDGVSLSKNNGENGLVDHSDTSSVEEETETSSHSENLTALHESQIHQPLSLHTSSQAAENKQPIIQDREDNNMTTAESETGHQTSQDVESEKQRLDGEKSFVSTTLRDDDDSRLQDSFVTASGDIMSSAYSDAGSTVLNPFYEQDLIAKQNEKARKKTKKTKNRKGLNESTPSRRSAHSAQSEKTSTKHTKQSVQEKAKDDQETSRLNQDEENDHVDDNDDSFEIRFPSVQELWASIVPSRDQFPPMKTEGDKQSASGGDSSHNNNEKETEKQKSAATCSLSPPWLGTNDSSSPAFESVSATATTNRNAAAKAKKQSNYAALRFPVPALETGSLPTSNSVNISDNQNQEDSHLAELDDHNDNQEGQDQHQDQEREQNRAPPPITIDLTLSSPVVSPVDQGSDEDFAKSQGLPRGAGWVKKNVPPTQRQTRRQTRSSTGGGEILLSSSPVRPTQRRKRTVRDL